MCRTAASSALSSPLTANTERASKSTSSSSSRIEDQSLKGTAAVASAVSIQQEHPYEMRTAADAAAAAAAMAAAVIRATSPMRPQVIPQRTMAETGEALHRGTKDGTRIELSGTWEEGDVKNLRCWDIPHVRGMTIRGDGGDSRSNRPSLTTADITPSIRTTNRPPVPATRARVIAKLRRFPNSADWGSTEVLEADGTRAAMSAIGTNRMLPPKNEVSLPCVMPALPLAPSLRDVAAVSETVAPSVPKALCQRTTRRDVVTNELDLVSSTTATATAAKPVVESSGISGDGDVRVGKFLKKKGRHLSVDIPSSASRVAGNHKETRLETDCLSSHLPVSTTVESPFTSPPLPPPRLNINYRRRRRSSFSPSCCPVTTAVAPAATAAPTPPAVRLSPTAVIRVRHAATQSPCNMTPTFTSSSGKSRPVHSGVCRHRLPRATDAADGGALRTKGLGDRRRKKLTTTVAGNHGREMVAPYSGGGKEVAVGRDGDKAKAPTSTGQACQEAANDSAPTKAREFDPRHTWHADIARCSSIKYFGPFKLSRLRPHKQLMFFSFTRFSGWV